MSKNIWLHIGLGSFHRAHQAWYLNELIKQGDDSWTIAAGNIRNDSEHTIEALRAQNGEYVLETVSPRGEREYEVIKSIRKLIPWQAGLVPLIEEGGREAVKVIAFTVTEAGYYLDSNFKLVQNDPALKADLADGSQTIYGIIAKILKKRMQLENGAVTLLCCDNVRHNGERFHDGLVEFLGLTGQNDIIEWMKANVTTPNTMVDRIVPRPAEELPARVQAQTGIADKAPVMGETFTQWVIEDNFKNNVRPALEKAGVELVESVIPYEEAKIRVLNVPHAAIAWMGTLLGKLYIHDSTNLETARKIAYDYVTEDVIASLGNDLIDLGKYRDVVLERFTNPYIKDTNQRVAADGFSKIPAQIQPTLIERFKQGARPAATAKLPALFFVFMERWHQGRLPFAYQDGILDEAAVHAVYESADPVKAFAADPALFGELAGRPEFEALLREQIEEVRKLIA
ncbi:MULTISPECIES: D-arabinitol 4-dehydrogenase [unclassified Neisseria]|uniref:D-arabinitol 4-dehydrogenase n=1 Tax=unclassified Neisseria TaxID=2623750 RepID=UPI0010728633|nr:MULTISPECIES: D-arabinitol 4-dehydrogenase [unclassified Neisseria]MBF0803010.1 mannitol dehydrogenase family protein [Neisseria sp. 19428wB4_WF04]TFU44306.1 mannitol dehydrogenase family protein [Neisseria sp. WF04]